MTTQDISTIYTGIKLLISKIYQTVGILTLALYKYSLLSLAWQVHAESTCIKKLYYRTVTNCLLINILCMP